MIHGGTIDRESYMNNIQEAAKMGKGYEALIDKSMELGALEARLVPAQEIVFDDRSFQSAGYPVMSRISL
jgi:hypothetical protein